MAHETLRVEIADGIARITLNRPDRLNAFNQQMSLALIEAVQQIEAQHDVRVAVLSGAGRGFCAGQDLSDPHVAPDKGDANLGYVLDTFYIPVVTAIAASRIPYIAAVNGVAAGAGASLALACDLVVATESASFIQPFAAIGLLPDAGGTHFLPRAVGTAQALGMALTGEKVPSAQAHALGLIWKSVPDADFVQAVTALAVQLAARPPLALAATKRAIRSSCTRTLAENLAYERNAQHALGLTLDYAEGVRAFSEKRPPRFVGR